MSSLWDNPAVNAYVSQLDDDTKLKYSRLNGSLCSSKHFEDPEIIRHNSLKQIQLMLRDGLNPKLLSEDERKLFVEMKSESKLKKLCDEWETCNV